MTDATVTTIVHTIAVGVVFVVITLCVTCGFLKHTEAETDRRFQASGLCRRWVIHRVNNSEQLMPIWMKCDAAEK